MGYNSIKRRLTQSTVVATGIAVTLLSLAFVLYDIRNFGEVMVQRLTAGADIVSLNSTTAILFNLKFLLSPL